MAYQLPIMILTMSTISVGISYTFPFRRDMEIERELKHCDKLKLQNIRHVVLVNETDGTIIRCKRCFKCPSGLGLPMPCFGQNVSTAEYRSGCIGCVAGVNYSTGENIQCVPCHRCKDGVRTEGRCTVERDNQTCEPCPREMYYNKTLQICLHCSCENMTVDSKRICKELGYEIQCGNPSMTRPTDPFEAKKRNWKMWYNIVIVCGGVLLLFLLIFCAVWRCKTSNHSDYSVCSKKWFGGFFCCREGPQSRSRPPSYTTAVQIEQNNGNCVRRAVNYFRQNSAPVTQDEKYFVSQGHDVPLEQCVTVCQERVRLIEISESCLKKSLKFFDMNAESVRQICKALKQNVDTGIGYTTLAGYMGFTANNVKEFEEGGKPCENMFRRWSTQNEKENTVMKLKGLVKKLKRDDVLQLLEKELHAKEVECCCSECLKISC